MKRSNIFYRLSQFSCSVVSNSLRPHGLQHTRLLCPWDSPGENSGVGCHFLLQCMKVKSENEVTQSCPTPSDPMDCSLPGSSIDGISQERVLEWGAFASGPQFVKPQLAEICPSATPCRWMRCPEPWLSLC